jgi:hypothetical protein
MKGFGEQFCKTIIKIVSTQGNLQICYCFYTASILLCISHIETLASMHTDDIVNYSSVYSRENSK